MRRRQSLPAILAVLVLVVGHLAGLAHAASTRHITCSEHGEELEATELAESLHACNDDHLVGLAGDAGVDHADCAIASMLQQSSATTSCWLPPLVAVLEERVIAAPPEPLTRSRALYRFAPKTSPPQPA